MFSLLGDSRGGASGEEELFLICMIFWLPQGFGELGNPRFLSPGNEEGKLAKISGDGDPLGPHWEFYNQE